MRTMESLRLDDSIEDILVTLQKQYQLIRLLKSSRNEQGLFLYLVLDRQKAYLALARHNLRQIESELTIRAPAPARPVREYRRFLIMGGN